MAGRNGGQDRDERATNMKRGILPTDEVQGAVLRVNAYFTRRGFVQDIPRSINLTAVHRHNRPVYIQYTSAFHPNGQSKFDVVSDPPTTGVPDDQLNSIWDEFMAHTWIYVKSQFYGRRHNIYRVKLSGRLDGEGSVATDCTCKDHVQNNDIDCKHMRLINVTAPARSELLSQGRRRRRILRI